MAWVKSNLFAGEYRWFSSKLGGSIWLVPKNDGWEVKSIPGKTYATLPTLEAAKLAAEILFDL